MFKYETPIVNTLKKTNHITFFFIIRIAIPRSVCVYIMAPSWNLACPKGHARPLYSIFLQEFFFNSKHYRTIYENNLLITIQLFVYFRIVFLFRENILLMRNASVTPYAGWLVSYKRLLFHPLEIGKGRAKQDR